MNLIKPEKKNFLGKLRIPEKMKILEWFEKYSRSKKNKVFNKKICFRNIGFGWSMKHSMKLIKLKKLKKNVFSRKIEHFLKIQDLGLIKTVSISDWVFYILIEALKMKQNFQNFQKLIIFGKKNFFWLKR